jgi:hypothetical protein
MRARNTVGAVCLITALAMLAGCQQPQQSADVNAEQSIAPNATAAEPVKMEVDQQATKQPSANGAPVKKPAAKAVPTKAAASKAPAIASATSGTVASDTTSANTPVVESRAVAMKKQDEQPITTIISGCLEEDGGMFRLKDTDGDHAPKSRSWKSGFIRKGSAKVDVYDAGNRLNLMSHIGNRVSVSGNLVDRDLHARSIRVTSERCD